MEETRLAVQFPITDSTDFDSLIRIEDALTFAFLGGASAIVEGHDISQGKFSVLLSAKAPLDSVVDRIKVALDEIGALKDATIAHLPTL
jgi:hypothetical protein